MKKRTRLIWLIIVLLVAAIVSWFKLLPAFNIKDGRFLGWVVSVTAGIVLIMISTAGNWWFGSYNSFFKSVEAVWKSKSKALRCFFKAEVGLLGILVYCHYIRRYFRTLDRFGRALRLWWR